MEEVATFVFANCAGAARGERCDPGQLGQQIRTRLREEKLQRVLAIGLSEVILSVDPVPRSHLSTPWINPGLSAGPSIFLDDLTAFQSGFGQNDAVRYYLAHLNSRDHRHKDAVLHKWAGSKASPRLAEQFRIGRDVYQGTAALLSSRCDSSEGIQLRPAGEDPLSLAVDDPLAYHGNRDSEPRSALVFRQLLLAEDLHVDLCFCQLETNTEDPRVAKKGALTRSRGVCHRIQQLERLNNHLPVKQERPTILLGDFNARPGSLELDRFCESYGFLHVLPKAEYPSPRGSQDLWGESHTFENLHIDAPDPERRESEQGWPYSHLEHRILIDHAFVRGLDRRPWHCELRLITLANEGPNDRVSDHSPIALTIYRRPNAG